MRLNLSFRVLIEKYICEVLFLFFLSIEFYIRKSISGAIFEKMRWDEGWYGSIVDNGYVFSGYIGDLNNVVFFPLYPMICKLVKIVIPGLTTLTSLILVSCIFAYLTIKLYYIIVRYYFNFRVAFLSLLMFLMSPYAFCLFLGFTESLFFSLVLAFFYYYGIKGKRTIPLIIIALASLTRVYGVLLIFVYIVELFYMQDRRALQNNIAIMPIAFIGISLFCIYQYLKFDNPILFLYAQIAWGHGSYNDLINILKIKSLLVNAAKFELYESYSVYSIFFVLVVFASVGVYKHLPRIFFSYYITMLIFFFVILSPSTWSMGRYLTCLFPFYIVSTIAITGSDKPQFTMRDVVFVLFCIFMFSINVLFNETFFNGNVFIA